MSQTLWDVPSWSSSLTSNRTRIRPHVICFFEGILGYPSDITSLKTSQTPCWEVFLRLIKKVSRKVPGCSVEWVKFCGLPNPNRMKDSDEWSSCWLFWSRWVHRWSEKSPKSSNWGFLKRVRSNVSSLQTRFSSLYLWSQWRRGVNPDEMTKDQRWRKSELGRTARNLPTGTDHLSDHSIPTEITLPGIQTGDHLHTRETWVPMSVWGFA